MFIPAVFNREICANRPRTWRRHIIVLLRGTTEMRTNNRRKDVADKSRRDYFDSTENTYSVGWTVLTRPRYNFIISRNTNVIVRSSSENNIRSSCCSRWYWAYFYFSLCRPRGVAEKPTKTTRIAKKFRKTTVPNAPFKWKKKKKMPREGFDNFPLPLGIVKWQWIDNKSTIYLFYYCCCQWSTRE